jgi:hypothetical protein
MKHLILVYPLPIDETVDERHASLLLLNFAGHIQRRNLPSAGVVKLPGGPLLIDREISESVLGQIYRCAEQSEMKLKLRFLTEH